MTRLTIVTIFGQKDQETALSVPNSIQSHPRGGVRFLAICGVIAPVLMLVLWTIASSMRSGYDQLNQYGSELGTSSNAFIMNTNFVVTGLLIIAFATGLFENVNGGRWVLIGSILLGLFGVGEVVGGFFPCDPGCPVAAQSLSQLAHNADAVIAFVAIALAPFLVSLGLNCDDRWRGYSSYSLATGMLAIVLFLVFSAASLGYLGFVGLFQRLFFAVLFLWIEVVALRLLRISNHSPSLRS